MAMPFDAPATPLSQEPSAKTTSDSLTDVYCDSAQETRTAEEIDPDMTQLEIAVSKKRQLVCESFDTRSLKAELLAYDYSQGHVSD